MFCWKKLLTRCCVYKELSWNYSGEPATLWKECGWENEIINDSDA